uniref:Uncharacterized protein n=1 Tax=Hemiselmis andersenii TaxID=464988 RepID=A0A6T8N607_HEMAN|mmetsp:Transcript_14373/g.33235  ORF Transcript_14373/g.33235 Transcript_14373/m.33235 type:complete len:123 (+) Transcript_14373:77-445(+)
MAVCEASAMAGGPTDAGCRGGAAEGDGSESPHSACLPECLVRKHEICCSSGRDVPADLMPPGHMKGQRRGSARLQSSIDQPGTAESHVAVAEDWERDAARKAYNSQVGQGIVLAIGLLQRPR